MRWMSTIVVVSLVALSAASHVDADDAHSIVQNGRAFHPAEVTITHGESLSFSNQDEFIHQIYVDVAGFDYDSEEQPPGVTLAIKFPTAGTFPVRCHIHPKMLLTVHVK